MPRAEDKNHEHDGGKHEAPKDLLAREFHNEVTSG